MSTTPRDFFKNMVRPAYTEWLADPLAEWKAKAAVSNADTLAERLFHYWHPLDPAQIGGAASASQYRTYLRTKVCADFGLVQDIHDGHKHFVLDRRNREVTKSSQTGVGQMGFGEGGFGEGTFGGTDQMIVELDTGTKRALSAVMSNVMTMWENELKRMGL